MLSDDGQQVEEMLSRDQADYFLSLLTNRQRDYAELLMNGYSYNEIAAKLDVSIVAVWRMVLRIRERLSDYWEQAGEDAMLLRWDNRVIEGLVAVYLYLHPSTSVLELSDVWYEHPVLKDYSQPDMVTLSQFISKFRHETKSLAS